MRDFLARGWVGRILAALVCGLVLLMEQPGAGGEADTSYEVLRERVIRGEEPVDFRELRLAYTRTPEYCPYGAGSAERSGMFAALAARQFDQALDLSRKILERNFVDLSGHLGALVVYTETGNQERAAFHRRVMDGLVKSIMESGAGTSPETANLVISVDEEYALLSILGLQPVRQGLCEQQGRQ